MTTTEVYGEGVEKVSCPHCARGWTLNLEETSLGEWEDVSHLCPACCGTGRKMDKAERKAYRAGRS